jgi:hypothetical protein
MKTLEQPGRAIATKVSSCSPSRSPLISSKIDTRHLARLAVVYVLRATVQRPSSSREHRVDATAV